MRVPAALIISLLLCAVAAPAAETDEMTVVIKQKEAKPSSKKKDSKSVKSSEPTKRDSETSLRYLINGNSRFSKKNFRSDGRNPRIEKKGLAANHLIQPF